MSENETENTMRASYQIAQTGQRIQRTGAALARTDDHFDDLCEVRDKLQRLESLLCNLTTLTCQNSDVDSREHQRIRVAWRHTHAAFKSTDHAIVTLNMGVYEPIHHPVSFEDATSATDRATALDRGEEGKR